MFSNHRFGGGGSTANTAVEGLHLGSGAANVKASNLKADGTTAPPPVVTDEGSNNHVWVDQDSPTAITGSWSATASATITEDASGGEATSELSVGQAIRVGNNIRTVISITDDDTIVTSKALTVSGTTVSGYVAGLW